MDAKKTTIYDVARVAGVSISTVSRVLNSPQRVREPTRQRVLETIEKLQFVPKAEASARARKGVGRIGVLTPSLTVPSFVERLRGVALALHDLDYELIVYSIRNETHLQHHIDLLSVSRRIDGLIVISWPIDETSLTRLMANNIEVVCIEIMHPLCCNITVNNIRGGELAAEYLLKKEKQRFCYVGESFDISPETENSRKRFQGFNDVLRSQGKGVSEEYIQLLPLKWTESLDMEEVIRQTRRVLALPAPPDAIFAYSDMYAIGVVKAVRSRKLRVPEDVAVVGFDDLDVAKFMELTTVDQHLEESGKLAVEVLLSRIAGTSHVVRNIELQIQIQARSSA